MDLDIRIRELRRAVDLIFDHIERDLKIDAVRIEEDYYWAIHPPELYDPTSKPSQLTVGQLYDDWHFLESMMKDRGAVSLMLIHVAPLLRYIGEKIAR